jgi:hypothetical protein
MFRYIETVILSFLLFLFVSPSEIYAVTIDISNHPTSISTDSFTVDVLVSGATNARNYLRVDLYQDNDGDKNYFGETFNGSNWYNGSDGTLYLPIDVVNSTASATIQAKIGSPNSTEYPGPGNYKLRIRRYTASGNPASSDAQNPVDIQISWSTPSPSPTNSPSPTDQPTNPPTASPTKSPTPKSTPTKSPTSKPSSTPTSNPSGTPESDATPFRDDVFLETTSTPQGIVAGISTERKKFPLIANIFIISGTAFMLVGVVGLYLKRKRQYNIESEKNN